MLTELPSLIPCKLSELFIRDVCKWTLLHFGFPMSSTADGVAGEQLDGANALAVDFWLIP